MITAETIYASRIQQSMIDDIVSYLDDCRVPADFITPRFVGLALEASYKPRPDFWRALTRETILHALERYAPGFQSELSFVADSPYEVFVERIDFMLARRSRDELNAEILLNAPASKRQFASESPYEYLVCELIERNEFELANTLISERENGTDGALELAEAQLAAREGRTFMTKHMWQATATRHAFIISRPSDADDYEADDFDED